MKMVTFMKVIGRMTRNMGKVFTSIMLLERNMRENGKMD